MTYGTVVALALEGTAKSPSVDRASRLTEGPGVSCRTPALATPCADAAVLAHAGLNTRERKRVHFFLFFYARLMFEPTVLHRGK